MNAWVWHKKKEPPFYRELRLLEMFIAISETIARPENNAKKAVLLTKKAVLQGTELGTDLKADRRAATKIMAAGLIHVLQC